MRIFLPKARANYLSCISVQHAIRCYSSLTPKVTKLHITLGNKPDLSHDHDTKVGESNKAVQLDEGISVNEKENDQLPPSLRVVKGLMEKYKDNVLLTQMGSFYELYFEQATKYAPKLNITLTNKNYVFGKIPFAGFPVSQLNRHLRVLVNQYGYSVTVVDQFKKDSDIENDSNKFQRRVTRIVTPGTFIDEAFENFKENTYLLSVDFPERCMDVTADNDMKVGLSWCDVSTGEIFVQQVLLRELVSTITRIHPKEIVLKENLLPYSIELGKWYSELAELKKYVIKYQTMPSRHRTVDSFRHLFDINNVDITDTQFTFQLQSFEQKEIAALRNLLSYISDHLPNFTTNFQLPQRQLTSHIMQIDSRTTRALELNSTVLNNSKKGSLISTVRRTVTPVGTRLLTQWISGPSMDLQEIKRRQRFVQYFKNNGSISTYLISRFKKIADLSRILQKFSFGRGSALDLIQIANSLSTANEISEYLNQLIERCPKRLQPQMLSLITNLKFDTELVDNVLKSLNEDEIIRTEKAVIEANPEVENVTLELEEGRSEMEKDGLLNMVVDHQYHSKLANLVDRYKRLLVEKERLEKNYAGVFIDSLGARKLTLKQRQNGDYALHIQASTESLKTIANNVLQDKTFKYKDDLFHVLSKSSQTLWVGHKLWSDLGYSMENALLKIKKEENNILDTFKKAFIAKSNKIRQINNNLGYLDTVVSFSVLANEKNLVCPKIDKSTTLEVVEGRHIIVEDGLASRSLANFVENDCMIDSGNLWVVTGPNMGGKSTFLRQNAIIVILAQIGCFVPAKSAHIGLVDKIFSRLGSADDLYNEMSTFMVEMIETSFILRGATDRSLAILDEIGRGTSGKEGVSIAYATLTYLIERNKCRSLFATHFGEDLQKTLQASGSESTKERIKFHQSSILKINDGQFCYDYKLKPGICTRSDALNVARLAGFPEEALNIAKELTFDAI
ncbi:mismatch repair ATPase MSH1 KNAG_0H03560 [Huiozyma naganishii CBS 8797]|uniref:DNA mismatch repair proteins mutS family domain-containing protein n=1 Tax=Huiozyma naganishii (strain ATCC MYA-139 / BCRC 22969 / CBS 8797 / KCTC 17520 / NBRC 10181 / NCYC 3082 / Yp74L-3) TaxID=1071383 RepID=J7RA67_HUIN7|nr:hypothetical protein KNAG_0H03560 [Kazachstania naganishii CBS 8797]CCK71770.1 hypothetical protein KNAG_0H03560 [Kazachstania naganishii CBS 8797]